MFGRGLFIIAQGFHKERLSATKYFVVAIIVFFFEVCILFTEGKFKFI